MKIVCPHCANEINIRVQKTPALDKTNIDDLTELAENYKKAYLKTDQENKLLKEENKKLKNQP